MNYNTNPVFEINQLQKLHQIFRKFEGYYRGTHSENWEEKLKTLAIIKNNFPNFQIVEYSTPDIKAKRIFNFLSSKELLYTSMAQNLETENGFKIECKTKILIKQDGFEAFLAGKNRLEVRVKVGKLIISVYDNQNSISSLTLNRITELEYKQQEQILIQDWTKPEEYCFN
jgi:hypothetical protein